MPERKRWSVLLVLSMGGGIIYILPYLSSYFYIPMKDAMHLNNTQLGLMTSVMGFTAMLFYWPGGWVADLLSSRKLITFSFVMNGLLGLWLATYPSFGILLLIQLLMGIFLTLTYWSALIKATRELGSETEQGRLFGFLEGGRNLTAVVVIALGLMLFARLGSNSRGLQWTIVLFSIALLLMACLSWFVIADDSPGGKRASMRETWSGVVQVVKLPSLWLVTGIILCAYVTSVGITYITPYSTDVYKQSVVFGGTLYTIMQLTSVVASPLAGWIADRCSTSTAVIAILVLMAMSLFVFVFVSGGPAFSYLLLLNSIVIGCAIYGLRGIYYALLEEGKIPIALTGTATGLISLIAYTPDIFIPVIAGQLLDRFAADGLGYKYFFAILAGFALTGAALTAVFKAKMARPPEGVR